MSPGCEKVLDNPFKSYTLYHMNLDRAASPHRGEHCKQKSCCCGGHNASNAKKSKTHNSTKNRLLVRDTRKALIAMEEEQEADYEDYLKRCGGVPISNVKP